MPVPMLGLAQCTAMETGLRRTDIIFFITDL